MARVFSNQSGGEFELFPEGTSATVLTGIHFVGKHEREWEGKKKIEELVILEHTAPAAGSDGRDLSTCEVVTFSFGEKSKLYNRVRAYMGGRDPEEGADLRTLLGKVALIEVQHKESGGYMRARVLNATALPRGMPAPVWSGTPSYTDIEDREAQPDPEAVPALVRKLLETRVQPQAAKRTALAPAQPAPRLR
jgi:hypothetical protein